MCAAKIAKSASFYVGQCPLKKLFGLPHLSLQILNLNEDHSYMA